MQDSSPTPLPGSKPKKPLDTVVKMALGVLIGSFALIWGGMYLSRPDRSIPPYTIGSQEETAVAIHVPDETSDELGTTLHTQEQRIGDCSRSAHE